MDEAEENNYFNDNPKIIPLFEVDILQALTSYVDTQGDIPIDDQTMKEILLQQEATDKEMKVSQRVQASALEEVNLADEGITLEPKTILITKEMLSYDMTNNDSSTYSNNIKMYSLGPSKT